ncbi:hypothetical protein ANCDUO_22533 [Ancylostoma duodenale]|uniref:Uncharacterized protein n=1 Tax=Ancylostoma duodenale TaxID=51022 RepID=A0A0C2FR83_9BILA|nr:hypothetical protein ANCDUO_22533 [Ancylostoma duodenale]
MSCQQRCTQVTTIAEKQQSAVMQAHAGPTAQCTDACSPKCAPECIQDHQVLFDQQLPVVGPASINPLQEQQVLPDGPLLAPGLTGPFPQQLPSQQPPIIPGPVAGEEAATYAPYPEGPTFIPLNSGSPLLQELLMTDPTLITGRQPSLTSGPLPVGGAYPGEFGQPAFITDPAGLGQSPQMLDGEPALIAGVSQQEQGLAVQQMPISGQFPAGISQPDLGLAGQPTLIPSSATADADEQQLVSDQPGLLGGPQRPQQGLAGQASPIPGQIPSGPAGLSQSHAGQVTPISVLFPVGPSGLPQPQQNLAGEPSLISTPSLLGQQPPFLGQPSFAEGTPEGSLATQPSLTSGPIAAGLGQSPQMLPGLTAQVPQLQQGPAGQFPAGLLQPQQGLIGQATPIPGQFLAGGPQLGGQPTRIPGHLSPGLLQPQQGLSGQPSLISGPTAVGAGPQQLTGSPAFPGGVLPSQQLLAGQPSLLFGPSATGMTQLPQLLSQPQIGAGAVQLPEQDMLPYPPFQSTSPILVASQPQQFGKGVSRKDSMIHKVRRNP